MKPAIQLLTKQEQQHLHIGQNSDASLDQQLTIAIDGNEANISRRVGSNTVAFQLLHALRKLDTNYRWVVYLKAPPLPDMPPESGNWHYQVIPFPKLWTQTRLPWELFFGKYRPDVFYSPGHYLPRWCPCPIVNTIMDTAYLDYPTYFTKFDLAQLTSWTKRDVQRADRVIAISQATKNDLIKHYSKPADQITVAHLGVDHSRYTFPQTDSEINRVKTKYHIPGDYILYLGTLQPRKNLPKLIKAFKIAYDQRRDKTAADASLNYESLSLVIAGKKGWLYEDIYAAAQHHNLVDKVIFTDYVPETDLPPLMAGARCLALVALYEGFGIPVIEAMAVGTPAVVSNVSSLPEIIDHAGFKVNPSDTDDIAEKLGQMLDLTSQQYVQLVDKGLKHAATFEWHRTAKTVLKTLEHAAGLPT